MFDAQPLTGSDLPARTLCLTFDDGPGHDTADIGDFLAAQGVLATFFVIGPHAQDQGEVLRRLTLQGHLIGNHTYSHIGLIDVMQRGGDPVAELLRTHDIISAACRPPLNVFRPPYGSWESAEHAAGANAGLARLFNDHPVLASYIGPIYWDISAEDYFYWERGLSASQCCAAYLKAIERADRGIVLMHDSSEDPHARHNNRTYQVLRKLVPALKRRGFRFVPLAQTPQVKAHLARDANPSAPMSAGYSVGPICQGTNSSSP